EVRDPAWATTADAHALHYETPGKPDRAARRRRRRPGDQCAVEDHACGLAGRRWSSRREGMACGADLVRADHRARGASSDLRGLLTDRGGAGGTEAVEPSKAGG